jgi:uncharacterized coiled-coil protein SlyX
MDDEDKIELILEWAQYHPNFDTDYVEDLQQQLAEGQELTERQSEALDNIIERFRIDGDGL